MIRYILLTFLTATVVCAGQTNTSPLTLDEALKLAMNFSKTGQLGRLGVDIATAELQAVGRQRYPQIRFLGTATYLNDPFEVKVGQGSMTNLVNETTSSLGLGYSVPSFPTQDVSLARGSNTPVVGSLMFVQPLTQLWRIDSSVRVAKAGVSEAQSESAKIDANLRLSVEELFARLQLEARRTVEKQAALAWQERRLFDAEKGQQTGELLDEVMLGLRATVIQARTEHTRSQQDYARLSLQLADLIGLSGEDHIVVDDQLPSREEFPLGYWTAQAIYNPDRLTAVATLEKATAGVRAARQAYIPEVSLIAGGYMQDGVPLADKSNAMVGVTLNWDVFDFGRRRADVARSLSQRRAAQVNRDRLEENAARQIRLMHQDLVFADEQIELTRQAVTYRKRTAELADQSYANGLALKSAVLEAKALLRKAEADYYGAYCQRHVALLYLYFLAGKL